ncbi:uncharacterized protein (DUF2236 family) [Prauserella shujinwangii]|uniref:Uncharacterized protein (DUF2236 family) n=1 Tax=Prauserella shujinwangii TaxID=1453103 RepID=A0A2T0LQ19_9PSEU|nr:oxygenase MpaB family protein [Prauserella shujinwangii]PRX45421.1 uncharacterized protein (DUF2236 family) [Prauserella shujinwangii]
MASTAPARPEALPGPGSVTWRHFAAAPGVLLSGTGLLLQVAHPVVGQGVLDHSEFRHRPWRRAWDTHLSTLRFVYGMGHGAHAEGRRLREVHRNIKGVLNGPGAPGRRYHALDPKAYSWVHLTLARFLVDTAATFGDPLDDVELEQMWREFRAIGRALGIRPHHMAATWAEAEELFDRTVHETLEANQSTADVLAALTDPASPSRLLPRPLWRLLSRPAARVVRLTTVGTLPPVLRERMNLTWTERDARNLDRLARTVRAVYRRLPEPLRYPPIAYSLILRARLRQRGARR